MKPRESKFILRAHRADGRYAPDDPLFAEALAEAARSPELAAWLENEHGLDAVVANKLDAIQPPADLRESILAGARASRLGRRWWQHPIWLAAAACLAFAASLVPVLRLRAQRATVEHTLTEFALNDAADRHHDHGTTTPEARALFASLREDTQPLTGGAAPEFDTMQRAGCKRFTVGGHDVYEVCIVRNGRWFHLYAARRVDTTRPPPAHTTITERGSVAVATWSTDSTVYTLASPAGRAALSALI